MRSLDLPDQPDEPGRAEHAGAAGRDRPTPKFHEVPDPDERGRAYEATRAHVSAETDERDEQGRWPDEAGKSSYWSAVPRFEAMWAHHEKHRSEPPAASEQDHPADPPGTYRSKGGFELKLERHTVASEAIDRVREIEPSISADIQTIEKENSYGGWLEGFRFRRKEDDRLKEKIAEQSEAESGESAADVLRRIPDALRYTYCFERGNYTRGYYDIKARLESLGHEMYQSTNYWSDPEYKGINTRWVTERGQRFEVQFHTQESFHAKHYVTHRAYERIRDLTTRRPELRELHEFQRKVSACVPVPNGAADIPDFKKEGF